MAEHDPPPPLKTGAGASPELVRALEALGRNTDAARLARVGAKLGPLLDASAPALPPAASWWQATLRKLSPTKLAVSGVVLGAAVIALIQYPFAESTRSVAPPPPPVALEAPTPAQAIQEPLVAAPPSAGSDEPSRVIAPSDGHTSHARAKTAAASKRAPRQGGAKPGTSAVGSQATPSAQTSETSEAAEPVAERSAAELAEEPVAKPQPKPAAKPIPPPPAAPGAPPLSEADLLYGARKALARQPAAALRLLDEHATRFQGGLLAPERELLAIEALRNLGRSAEAAQRLQQFKARYPKSLHLRRLEGKDGADADR